MFLFSFSIFPTLAVIRHQLILFLCFLCFLSAVVGLWRRLINTPQKAEETQSEQIQELNLEKVTNIPVFCLSSLET